MTANPIWIAGYFGPVAGASPVWIAPGDGTVPSAVQSQVVSYFAPVAGATAVWIAGFFAPPPAAIGATPITISGWGGSGGGGGGGSTSVWSAADASAKCDDVEQRRADGGSNRKYVRSYARHDQSCFW